MMLAIDNTEVPPIDPRNLIQGSEEWKAARLGKVTASRISDMIARTKTGWGASRANYMSELLCERLTGTPAEHYISAPMQYGTEMESEARAAYSFRTDSDVELIGFVPHPTIAMAGCSPDGLVGGDGGIEIKCPNTATHLETLLSGTIPAKHTTQIQFTMGCTQRQWWDFVSYDRRVPEPMRIFLRRVERDDLMIAQLEVMVKEFLAELVGKITDLEQLYCGGQSRLMEELRGSI